MKKNRFFDGHVISTLPKQGNVRKCSGPPTGEIWSTKCTIVDVKKVSKNFPFGGLTPKPEVVFANFFVPFCRSLPDMGHGEETASLPCIV